MSKYKLVRFILIYLLPFFATVLCAQTSSVAEERIRNMFPDNQKLQWVRYYKGRIDDVHDVALTVGCVGDTLRGSLIYLRSKEEFSLLGLVKKDSFLLQELDVQDSTTGRLNLRLNLKTLSGTWSNADNSIGGIAISLTEVSEEPNLPSFCGDNKWIHYYRGIVENDDVEILMQRAAFNEIRGVGYFKKLNRNCSVKGEWDEKNNLLILNFKDAQNNKIGSLKGRYRTPEEIAATYTFPNGQKVFATFTMDDDLKIGCMENADYTMSYDITYPKTKDQSFNIWIEKIVNTWLDDNKKIIAEAKTNTLKIKPTLRNFARAYAWTDLEYYSPDVISGYLTFGASWSQTATERMFTYDFTTEKELTLANLFNQGVDYQSVVRNYILLEIQKNKLYQNDTYKSWIISQPYDSFSLRRDGLTFSTQPSMLFGKQSVTVPFSVLKNMLKQEGPIWKLAVQNQ